MLSLFRSGPIADIISGQLRYSCPPSAELPRLVDSLCTAVRAAWEIWEPPFVAALASWGLSDLHLFSDGNRRTARGLAFAILTRAGMVSATDAALDKSHGLYRMRETRTRYCNAIQSITDALSAVGGPMAVSAEALRSGAMTATMFTPLSAIIFETAEAVARET